MKFVLSLVLVAYVATVVESIFLKEAMDSMKKLTSSDSYSSPSYSSPSYSAPSYSAPSYSAPSYSAPSYSAPSSYSAPVYQEVQPVYVVKPESTEYVTEVRKVKHVPVYPVKKYKTKHVYSTGYGSGESYSRESDEYGTYNSGSHMIYRREAPEPSPSAKFWQNLAQKPGNGPNPEQNPAQKPGNGPNPEQNEPWRG